MPHKRSSNSWPSRWSCFSWLEHIYKHIVVKFIDLVAGFVGTSNLLSGAGAEVFERTCFNYPTLGNLYTAATYDALQRLVEAHGA